MNAVASVQSKVALLSGSDRTLFNFLLRGFDEECIAKRTKRAVDIVREQLVGLAERLGLEPPYDFAEEMAQLINFANTYRQTQLRAMQRRGPPPRPVVKTTLDELAYGIAGLSERKKEVLAAIVEKSPSDAVRELGLYNKQSLKAYGCGIASDVRLYRGLRPMLVEELLPGYARYQEMVNTGLIDPTRAKEYRVKGHYPRVSSEPA